MKDINIKNIKRLKPKNSIFGIKVGNERKNIFKIGIANCKLYNDDFYKVLEEKKNHSRTRYDNWANIINDAKKHKCDILIMPESYTPFEWLPYLENKAVDMNMAIITGVEHLCYDKNVYNITAIILSYINKFYSYSHIFFHNKVHFSPDEAQSIISYGFTLLLCSSKSF